MKIICFGDSNTYGFDPRSYFGGRYDASERWVDIIEKISGWKLINMGQNGLSIPASEYETTLYNNMFLREKADLVLIMLGSNDLLQGLSAEAVSAKMKRFISGLSIDKAKILLISPPQFNTGLWVEDKSIIEHSLTLGEKYSTLAQKLGIQFADANQWGVSLAYDGVHFTSAGHHAFANGLYKKLNNKEI